MDTDERPRSIRFPQWLWDEIDRDALRCKRSAVKQMEAVFTAYYRGDTTALNLDRLGAMGQSDVQDLANEVLFAKPPKGSKLRTMAASNILDKVTETKKRKAG